MKTYNSFKKLSLFMLMISFASLNSQAQTLNDYLKKADKLLKGKNGQNVNNGGMGSELGSGLSNTEIVGGLKEALQLGARNDSQKLNVSNGFFGNQMIKVLMPPEARNIETTLR